MSVSDTRPVFVWHWKGQPRPFIKVIWWAFQPTSVKLNRQRHKEFSLKDKYLDIEYVGMVPCIRAFDLSDLPCHRTIRESDNTVVATTKEVSTTRRRLKSPRPQPGISTHPTVMNSHTLGSVAVGPPILDYFGNWIDLENARSMPRVWSIILDWISCRNVFWQRSN